MPASTATGNIPREDLQADLDGFYEAHKDFTTIVRVCDGL